MSSQIKGIKPLRICEEQPKSSTAAIKDAHLSLANHDETGGMLTTTTTTDLKKCSVQLEREVELKADAVAESIDTHETVSVNDPRVVHLSRDVNAKL
ncbi:unnamed protein product [Trichobilharzia regenti]|nr:unnamed protein product [Trichobilharzia regenti]